MLSLFWHKVTVFFLLYVSAVLLGCFQLYGGQKGNLPVSAAARSSVQRQKGPRPRRDTERGLQ